MKFISTKQTLTTLAVFLTILFLGSCSVADDTAPPGPQPDYMSFALTNLGGGALVDPTTQLSRGDTYRLTITPTNGTTIPTADYTIKHIPLTAITINVTRTNSVDFVINNTATTFVTVTVTHKTDSSVSESVTLNLASQVVTTFQQNIENATTVPNLILANAITREVLSPLGVATGTPLVKRYVTESGGATTQDGTSWATAWAAANLKSSIDAISDATANKVYLIMVAGGTYKPNYSTTAGTTERAISFSMKNHVAIMGGFQTGGGWERTGTTIFSGDIGNAGNGDNSYHVFNNSDTLNNAHLYEVTITNGNANGVNPQNQGGGMYNVTSSPVLTRVVFSGNSATGNGGGMNNVTSSPVLTEVVFSGNTAVNGGGMANLTSSSPVLTEVVFSGNTAAASGGGMFNENSSSPVLTRVVFSGNTATGGGGGGGMLNQSSSPVLTRVVFSGNTATGTLGGGGMANYISSPVIIGAVFTNNRAANGGGMFNENGGQPGPLIVNSIFSGNTLSGSGSGPNIAVDKGGSYGGTENIRIAGSVLGLGLAQPTNGIVGYTSLGGTAALNISYHSLANTAVNFGADANLTINGMSFPYPTITSGSAVNLGLFVRRNGTTYYFSETEAVTSWHTGFTSTGAGGLAGTPAALPTTGTTEDLTATDIAGNARNARPDAGVYEVQ